MRYRWSVGAILSLAILLPLTSCISSPSLTSIVVSPSNMNFGGTGLQAQLTATGYYTHPGHPAKQEDITDQVNWASSVTACVTVTNTGMITSGANDCTNIIVSASAPGFNGLITGTMTVNVTQPTTGGSGPSGAGDVTKITIIPGEQSVPVVGDQAQFLAIGTTSTGVTVNLNGLVAWTSSSPQVATVGATSGLATALAQGTSTITALFTNQDGAAADGSATFTVLSGVSEPFTAISVIPGVQALAASQTGQFIALGTSGSTGLIEDVTNSSEVSWAATIPTIATVSTYPATPAGLATGVSQGTTDIVATLTNPVDGTILTSQATVNVTNVAAPEPLLSLTIIPNSITVGALQETGNFLAIGTYSTEPNVRDLTNSVTWVSSEPNLFPVSTNGSGTPNPGAPAGVASAWGSGGAVIIAEASDPTTKSIQTATATFNCPLVLPNPPLTAGSCYEGSQGSQLLATLTVYNEGLNTTNWLVTAPSATGTADVIHCGPGWTGGGGSVCTASYPAGATTPSGNPGVVLTAQGGAFGGWSYSCIPSDAQGNYLNAPPYWTAAGPNYCVAPLQVTVYDPFTKTDVTVLGDDFTVGAIFN